jgi:Ni/Fe-hydrogenase subunit HybB-like protein
MEWFSKNWQRFEEVSLVLAGLSTPLVLSVHSIVSMDFATSVVPGWHTTIFPPYFVVVRSSPDLRWYKLFLLHHP